MQNREVLMFKTKAKGDRIKTDCSREKMLDAKMLQTDRFVGPQFYEKQKRSQIWCK